MLRRQLADAESLQVASQLEVSTSHLLLEQLGQLDLALADISGSLDSVAVAASAEDKELREFYSFKGMLHELQVAVRDSRAASRRAGSGELEAEGTPLSIKNSDAFKKAGAVLRGWIDRFDEDARAASRGAGGGVSREVSLGGEGTAAAAAVGT